MHFKSKELFKSNSLIYSISIHFVIVLLFMVSIKLKPAKIEKEVLEFAIIEKFKEAKVPDKPLLKIDQPKKIQKKVVQKRKVFGISRKTVTSSEGVEVKQGNTLAKTPDTLKLNKDDADSIPIPTDEFLITSMPVLIEEIRPNYPESQKKLGKEGKVIFEIIIDDQGVVKEAIIISSLGEEFDQAAKKAILNFKFKPAKMGKKSVPVKIKYAINFVLEKS